MVKARPPLGEGEGRGEGGDGAGPKRGVRTNGRGPEGGRVRKNRVGP